MPIRTVPLSNGEFYHIYNRGTARQPTFLNRKDYVRFYLTISYYRFSNPPVRLSHLLKQPKETRNSLLVDLENTGKKLVELISFVFIPNHFHFLLRQVKEDGISRFVSKTINSYTRFFNTKYDRDGALFKGAFQAVHVDNEDQLIHLNRYIHINPTTSFVIRESELFSYPWSSLPDFLKGSSTLVDVEPVLSHSSSINAYKKFILDQLDYAKKLKEIENLTLEK